MPEKRLEKFLVFPEDSIKETMRKVDLNGFGIALITNHEKKLLGIVTDGDIRRAILKGTDIGEKVEGIMNRNPVYAFEGASKRELLSLVRRHNVVEKIPILGKNLTVKDIAIFSNIEEGNPLYISMEKKTAPLVRKVLVIGGAGYLGSVLVRKLLEKGFFVRVLDNLTFGNDGIKELFSNNRFELFEGDIRKIDDVVRAIIGMDAVVHLAAIVGDSASSIEPISTVETNYLATKLIAETCKHHQVNRLVFASSCSVYGANSYVADESTELNPVSLYARTKIKSEEGLLEMSDENFAPCILRMATLFGVSPRMRFDLVVNLLTAKALNEKEITIFGGNQFRPLVHVEDAAQAYIDCLRAPIEKIRGQVFNVGADSGNYRIIDLGRKIKELVPEAKLVVEKKEADDIRTYKVSFEKISKELGFAARKTVDNGVKEIRAAFEEELFDDYSSEKYSVYSYLKKNVFGKRGASNE